MPDYVRIGPPWGQINWLPNSGLRGPAEGGATWPATAMGWSASGASCATTQVASWGISTAYGFQSANVSGSSPWGFPTWNTGFVANPGNVGGWAITAGTQIPSGQILAVAQIPVPSVRGVWSFQGEVYGASNVRVWGQVQVLATGGSAYASWNVATGLPSVSGQRTPGVFRWTGQFPQAVVGSSGNFSGAASGPPKDQDALTLLIRAGDTVASGDTIHITQLGLFQLDQPKLPDSAAAIGSVYAGATLGGVLLPYPFSSRSRDVWLFDPRGLAARYPAMPSYDARQPCGLAIEIGSWLRDGFDYGGAGVEKRQTQDTSLTDAGALAYEGYTPRSWQLPYIVDTTAHSPSMTAAEYSGQIDRVIEADPVVLDVVPQNSTWMIRFDVHTISNIPDSSLRFRRQNLLTGTLVPQTAPIGYTPRPQLASSWGAAFYAAPQFPYGVGGFNASSITQFYVQIQGDRSAYLIAKSPFGNAFAAPNPIGWMAAYQPGATIAGPAFWGASYVPSTGSVASMSPGLAAGGSQLKFPISLGSALRAHTFFLPPEAVGAIADTVRMFVLAGPATACTVPIYAAVGKIAGNTVVGASPFSVATTQVGFMNPLITAVASEPQTIQLVDLGEVQINKTRRAGIGQAPIGMQSGGAGLYTSITIFAGTAASTNAFGGAIDSLVLMPAGPSCLFFGIPSTGGMTQGPLGQGVTILMNPQFFSMHPSIGVYMDVSNVGPSILNQGWNVPGAWGYDMPAPVAIDQTALTVGPYPLLPPGIGQMTFMTIVRNQSPGESAGTNFFIPTSRPMTGTAGLYWANSNLREDSWFYYPRWAFLR